MSWGRSTFFKGIFGFDEGEYAATRDELARRATFSAPPPTSGSHGIATLPAPAERCLLRTDRLGEIDAGTFYEPSVDELHARLRKRLESPATAAAVAAYAAKFKAEHKNRTMVVSSVVGESRSMHSKPKYAGCVFQAASQFNYLEFPSPGTTPEHGIGGYEFDRTQGPACAIACAVGTAVRNYLIPPLASDVAANPPDASEGIKRGQRADCQRNGLADLEARFLTIMREHPSELPVGASAGDLSRKPSAAGAAGEEEVPAKAVAGPKVAIPWRVRSGYIDAPRQALEDVNVYLRNPHIRDELRGLLRVGVHENTAVADEGRVVHPVTQVYCSAVSVGYSRTPGSVWAPLATLVLEGCYESTFLAAILATITAIEQGEKPPTLLLTKVGGGVFGNSSAWIKSAMKRAIDTTVQYGVPMRVEVVHYGSVEHGYEDAAVGTWSV